MKINVCEICYYSGTKSKPKLVQAKYNLSIKQRGMRFKISACEEHKSWLKDRQDKGIVEIDDDLMELRTAFYRS